MNSFFSFQHVHFHTHTQTRSPSCPAAVSYSALISAAFKDSSAVVVRSSLQPSDSTRPVLNSPVCSSAMERCFKNCLKSYLTVEFRDLWWVCVYLSVGHILYEGHFPDSTSHVCPLCFYHIFSFRSLEYIRKHNTWVQLHKTMRHAVWAVFPSLEFIYSVIWNKLSNITRITHVLWCFVFFLFKRKMAFCSSFHEKI